MAIRKPVYIGDDGFLEEFSLFASDRGNVVLTGAYNGVNRDFLLPEGAVHTPPSPVVKVYHGGRRLNAYEYQVLESVSGSGVFDKVHLTSWAPGSDN